MHGGQYITSALSAVAAVDRNGAVRDTLAQFPACTVVVGYDLGLGMLVHLLFSQRLCALGWTKQTVL